MPGPHLHLTEELSFVLLHAMGLSGSVTLEAALQCGLIQADGRDMLRRRVDAASARLKRLIRIAFERQSVPATKILVAGRLGVSIMPYGAAAAEPQGGSLSGFQICEALPGRTLYMARPAR